MPNLAVGGCCIFGIGSLEVVPTSVLRSGTGGSKESLLPVARHPGTILPELFTSAWFQAAVRARALVLLEAGLFNLVYNRQPSGGGIGTIIGACIEGDRRAWGNFTNGVDDHLE